LTAKNCLAGNWPTESEHRVNEHLVKNAYCHICSDVFIENSFINWHPDYMCGCHTKCRDGLPKPAPPPPPPDPPDEPSGRKEFLTDSGREFTVYDQPKWNDGDESMLEEMWKDEKSLEEIADALTRRLPDGYERSEGAVRVRIKKLGIEEKTGRYFHSGRVYGNQIGISSSGRKYPRWNDDDVLMLEEMWKDEESLEEIANRLDRTVGAIEYRIRKEKIEEKTGRCLPPTDKQLNWLRALGYQEIPTCRKDAMEKIEEMLSKPASTKLEADLKALGHTGPMPKTNQDTWDAIKKLEDPTERQIEFLKRICVSLGKEFEMPLNKLEASKMLDQLIEEGKSKQIRIPTRDGRSKLKKMDSVQDDGAKCPDCDGLSALKDNTIDCKRCRNEGTLEAYEHVKSLKFKCPKCEGDGCDDCVYTGAREDYEAFKDHASEFSDPADDAVDYEEDYDDED